MAASSSQDVPALEISAMDPSLQPKPTGWRDLGLVVLIAVLGMAMTSAPAALRVPLGLLAVLVAPGYALTAAVFPTDEHLDRVERIALTISLSLAMVTVEGILIEHLLGGLRAGAIVAVVSATTLGLVAVAAARRARAQAGMTARPDEVSRVLSRPPDQAARVTQAIVVAAVLVAALAFALTVGSPPPRPTELYVLGSEGKTADYPRELTVGQPFTIRLGVHQGEDARGGYRLVARLGEASVYSTDVSLGPGQSWEEDVKIVATRPGRDQDLTIRLELSGQEQPFRTIRLWLDVIEARTG